MVGRALHSRRGGQRTAPLPVSSGYFREMVLPIDLQIFCRLRSALSLHLSAWRAHAGSMTIPVELRESAAFARNVAAITGAAGIVPRELFANLRI
jgi:hypothetical protein